MSEKIKFEESMAKIAEIVTALESGDGTLDEMIRLYSDGMKLVDKCSKQLDAYEATITKLSEQSMETKLD